MNNKGITLIEIIISIVLISIVLIFLFSLLITVNDINYQSEVNSTYLINKSLILKNIEEDFSKASEIKIVNCIAPTGKPSPINQFFPTYAVSSDYFPQITGIGNDPNFTKNKCINFKYKIQDESDPTIFNDSDAYLGIYYYKTKEMYVISYVHGTHKSTRTLPEFETVPANLDSLENNKWLHNGKEIDNVYNTENNLTDGEFHIIYIPIIGSDGKDYSLNISYYKPQT